MKTLQSTISPSNVGIIYPLSRHIIHQDIFSRFVGMIYPIPTKASNCVKCPKLFDFISIRTSKCLFSSPRPKGAQKLSNLHSSPKRWHDISNDISNTNIYTPKTVGRIYPVQILYFKNVHSNCVSSNRVQQLSQSVCVGVTLSFGWLGSNVRTACDIRTACDTRSRPEGP